MIRGGNESVTMATNISADEAKYAFVGDAAAVRLLLFLRFKCLMKSVGYEGLSGDASELCVSCHRREDFSASFQTPGVKIIEREMLFMTV